MTRIWCRARGWFRWRHWPADMALLSHGAMGTVFARPFAPSTLGSFLREFRFGHVRQLDAVASRLLAGLGEHTPVLAGAP